MGNILDLTGKTFGELTVIKRAEDYISPSGYKMIQWECKCSCGQTRIVIGNNLKNGKTKNCGCLSQRKMPDLVGKQFGELTVLDNFVEYRDKNNKKRVKYKCSCSCGNEIFVRHDSLLSGLTKSCGCTKGKRISESNKKYNVYELNNKYSIGFTENTNKKFYFDLEDYDKIKKYCWSEDHEGYIIAPAEKNGVKTKIRLHRLIMDVLDSSKNILIDHINHNTYDNRKNNLRIVSSSQNSMNHKILKKNRWGTSGIRFIEERNKWRAQIVINRQTIELGTFNNKEDAIKARKEAEEKYFGEYSYENSMKISQKDEVI